MELLFITAIIIDILLGEIIQSNDGLYQFVTIFSSVAKLLPQFLGQLCFVEGMSGIDQQFIYYFRGVGRCSQLVRPKLITSEH